MDEISWLYTDLAACFLAIANALEKKGVLTKQELSESFQERLLTLTVDHDPEAPLVLLRQIATKLPKVVD